MLESGDERPAKAVQPVAVGTNGGVFDMVEVVTDLFGSVDAMVEVRDEAGDGSLEVDVVFPESVVGVDEQGLIDGMARLLIGALVRGLIRSSKHFQVAHARKILTKIRINLNTWLGAATIWAKESKGQCQR